MKSKLILSTMIALLSLSAFAQDSNYKFTTSNFDDGWVSTIKEDWVEVTKGNIVVLLHYPRKGTIFPADPEPLTVAAWNILVAPRYKSLSNFKVVSPNDWHRSYMGCGNLVDANGRTVYVALYRNTGGWMEFITPDKTTFVNEFGVDADKIGWNADGAVFNSMAKMASYNKFAVAASDLAGTGKWSDHFSSNTFYTNYYTGSYEGMSTYSSSQSFEFGAEQTYKYKIVAVNYYAGQSQTAKGKGAGTFQSIGNWQLSFSEIEGKTKTFDVYFTAIKGGRVLFMNDAQYPGSGVFTGFSKE